MFYFYIIHAFCTYLTLLKWAVSMLHRLVVLDADHRKVIKRILSGIHHLIWPRVEPLQSKLFDLLAHNGESNNALPVLLLLKKVFKKSFSVERVLGKLILGWIDHHYSLIKTQKSVLEHSKHEKRIKKIRHLKCNNNIVILREIKFHSQLDGIYRNSLFAKISWKQQFH